MDEGLMVMVSNMTEVDTSSEIGPVCQAQWYSEFLTVGATWGV